MTDWVKYFQRVKHLLPDQTPENVASVLDSPFWQKIQGDVSSAPLRHPSPQALPCANVQRAKDTVCKDPGTMACSACKLVSYCSKECQTAHWKRHKRDCGNSTSSSDWIPNSSSEPTPLSFVTESDNPQKEEFSAGISLWGTKPAVDVINLACNENDRNKDLSLAFVASGDLRHILQSFNGLPSDYSGHLKLLVNHTNPIIFCRNIVLLLILGTIPDATVAADIALHFWYSIFMPPEYHLRITTILTSFVLQLKAMKFPMPLGPCSTFLTFFQTQFLTKYFVHFGWSGSHSAKEIQDEYNRVRSGPSRQDHRDRVYASLKPSHRVAFHQYRRSGFVLPFGAKRDHFTDPNNSLFSLEGKWLQTDSADPLDGWDIPTVIDIGKAHGAHPEDIYGCLYFFLSDQLLPVDPRRLANFVNEKVLSEYDTPTKFDRVDVSNVLDANHVGLHDVLTFWTPLLEDSPHATIIGHFMDWTTLDQAAEASGEEVTESPIKQVTEKERSEVNLNEVKNDFSKPLATVVRKGVYILPFNVAEKQVIVHHDPGLDDTEVFYENSEQFFQFLQSQGLDDILKETGLRLRDKHHVVPHVRGFPFAGSLGVHVGFPNDDVLPQRILAPLQGPPSALPEFPDDDTRYYYTKLTSHTWSDRYVEFERDIQVIDGQLTV